MQANDILERLIPYRLNAIEAALIALAYRNVWETSKTMHIHFDGKLCIEGNSYGFTNSAIEAGCMHARALLEFLGLARSKAHALISIRSRRKGDIGIEHFSKKNGAPLARISPQTAIATYSGPATQAERALLCVFELTNKELAHLTAGSILDGLNTQDLVEGLRGTQTLVINHVYTPLELEPPQYEIKSRGRDTFASSD